MRKRHQFQRFESSDWRKETVQSSQELRDHLKTETFFQRRQRDFQLSSSELSSSELSSSELSSSETDVKPTATSCQNLKSSLVNNSDPESVAESFPISDNPCLDLPSTLQTRPVPKIRLRDRVTPPIPASRVLHVHESVDIDDSSDLDPKCLSDDDTLSDIHKNAYHQSRRSMVDEWVQSTLVYYNLLSSYAAASTTEPGSDQSLI
jgi:hypothetical protein